MRQRVFTFDASSGSRSTAKFLHRIAHHIIAETETNIRKRAEIKTLDHCIYSIVHYYSSQAHLSPSLSLSLSLCTTISSNFPTHRSKKNTPETRSDVTFTHLTIFPPTRPPVLVIKAYTTAAQTTFSLPLSRPKSQEVEKSRTCRLSPGARNRSRNSPRRR